MSVLVETAPSSSAALAAPAITTAGVGTQKRGDGPLGPATAAAAAAAAAARGPTMARPLLRNAGTDGWIVQKFGGTSVGKFPDKVGEARAKLPCPALPCLVYPRIPMLNSELAPRSRRTS